MARFTTSIVYLWCDFCHSEVPQPPNVTASLCRPEAQDKHPFIERAYQVGPRVPLGI